MPLSPENRKFLIIGGALIVAVWLFAATRSTGPTPRAATSPTTGPVTRTITAEVRLARARVEVVNRDTFAWTGTTVRLNPGLTGRYDCELGTVAPAQQIVVALDDCTNSDGERFDWQRRKPAAVAVKTDQGERYFGGK